MAVKVRLEIPSWIALMLHAPHSDMLILEKEKATVGDLLSNLAAKYTDFDKVVFNPQLGEAADQVIIVLNDSLLQDTDMTGIKLNDGDSIVLLPVFSGG